MAEEEQIKTAVATFTCKEGKSLTTKDGLQPKQADRLCTLAERYGKQLKRKPNVLLRIREGIKAQQVVGVLAVPGATLEILPKIDGENHHIRRALVHMLAASYDLRVADGELAALQTQRHSLLEILIGLFAKRLLAAVRRGLPHRYIAHEEDLTRLRGKLNATRQLTRLAARPDLLACRFDEFSENTPLNRVLKAAVARLAGVARSADNRRRLAELGARLEAVGETSAPLREPVRLDRTNLVFHDLYRLARLFLKGDWQTTTAGKAQGFALLFPMNELFENFIGQCLIRALAPRKVDLQPRLLSALRDENDQPLFGLQPDAVIKADPALGEGSRPIVLDVKWKRLDLKATDRKCGVSQDDVYQMLTYAQAYNAQHSILLYPWPNEPEGQAGVHRRWTIAGTERRLHIATVDVRYPEQAVCKLRAIVAHVEKTPLPAAA